MCHLRQLGQTKYKNTKNEQWSRETPVKLTAKSKLGKTVPNEIQAHYLLTLA